MSPSEQEYAKSSFEDVAHHYDQIAFFKLSAQYVTQLIQAHTRHRQLQVLDVACGTGNVVLECAQQLSLAQFDALDIAEGMLDKARLNAKQRELNNIRFMVADITEYEFSKQYDVITCSYALFFLPDAHQVLATLSQQLKPDGLLIFTSFQSQAFTPVNQIILGLLKEYGSASAIAYEPESWQNLQQVSDIRKLCQLAQVGEPQIIQQAIRYPLNLDEWWHLLNNTGFKGMLMELDEHNYDQVKQQFYQNMAQHSDANDQVELVADSFFCLLQSNNQEP